MALAAGWQEETFPKPNGGRLVFTIMSDRNPACASYDGAHCLWGQTMHDIDFSRVKPLVCGAAYRQLYGVTGFEDPNHWCNLALHARPAQTGPVTSPSPAGGYRMSDWSGWGHDAGVEFRYRIGWDPAKSPPDNSVDGIFEVRNSAAQPWIGTARSVCADTHWSMSNSVTVTPGHTIEVRFRAANCGNAKNPSLVPRMFRSSTL